MPTKNDKPIVVIKGLAGYYEKGRSSFGTYSRGPLRLEESQAPVLVDKEKMLTESNDPVKNIWEDPNLDLALPDDNVRSLFEGCIGHEGTTQGHRWNGDLTSLKSTDSIGLNVWLTIMEAKGAIIVRR